MTTIRTRAQWGARPGGPAPARLALPTPELWLHHTAGNERGPAGMLTIQRAHMAKGWADIGYSFVIDPATLIVYEGRGAGVVGAHTEGHNSRSHGICVMGNYDGVTQPSDRLVHAIADLVAYGHRQGWWPDHLTGGHRDTKPTDCPGRHLYAAIRRINAEAEAILAGDIPTTEGDPMATADVEAAQRALNSWLTPDRQLRTDGDWGPASTAALRDILDRAARRIKELEAALTNQPSTGNTDAMRKLAALRAALLEVVG